MTVLFVLGAIVAALASLAVNLMTAKPKTVRGHMRALARLGIFAACLASVARVLTEGVGVTPERCVLMVSLAVLYLAQARCEAVRQSEKAVDVDETDEAGA